MMVVAKVYKFEIPEGVMALVPESGKLFLIPKEKEPEIPDFVECNQIEQPNRGFLTSTSLVLTEKCNMH